MRNLLVPVRRIAAYAARHRSVLLFGAALGFGALAVFGARGYLAERLAIERARLTPTQPTVEVVVARRDLPPGAFVDPENMALRSVPADLVPGSAVLPEGFDEHLGARIALPMRSGEPLLTGAIEGADAAAFSNRVRPGIRAMSVLVDEVNSVSGMLQPGDRIDLLFTVRPPVAPGMPPAQEVTSTLMQDLPVLATGRQVRPDSAASNGVRHFTAITVEVSPAQAQELIVAQRAGKLTAMLRNPEDRQPLRPRTMDLNALLGIEPLRRVATVPQAFGPEIIIGGRGALVSTTGIVQAPLEGFAPAAAIHPGPAPLATLEREADARAWQLHRFERAAVPQTIAEQPQEAQQ